MVGVVVRIQDKMTSSKKPRGFYNHLEFIDSFIMLSCLKFLWNCESKKLKVGKEK